MFPVHTVLHPTDFSERSTPALGVAISLARDYSARLVIVHVSPSPVLATEFGAAVELPTGWEEQVRAKLDAVPATDPGVPVSRFLAVGDPAAEILRLAGVNRADLIVMGTHGRTGLGRLLAGSVAEAVSRAAQCPVLTVRAPFAPPATAPAPTPPVAQVAARVVVSGRV